MVFLCKKCKKSVVFLRKFGREFIDNIIFLQYLLVLRKKTLYFQMLIPILRFLQIIAKIKEKFRRMNVCKNQTFALRQKKSGFLQN